MPVFKQETATRPEVVFSDIVVGKDYRVLDMPVEENQTLKARALMVLKANGYWRVGSAAYADATAWAAGAAKNTGDVVVPTAGNNHWYQAQDGGTTGGVEPAWPTDGSTVVDNDITWKDMGTIDDLATFENEGAGFLLEDITSGAGEHPTVPVLVAGEVNRAKVTGVPADKPVGSRIGLIILR